MRKMIAAALLSAAVAVPATLAIAGPMHHRANLLEAEKDLSRAWEHINASQRANEFDEGGHAAKAKELIGQAKAEIRQAAEWDNHRR